MDGFMGSLLDFKRPVRNSDADKTAGNLHGFVPDLWEAADARKPRMFDCPAIIQTCSGDALSGLRSITVPSAARSVL
jgi:hypothetical protein